MFDSPFEFCPRCGEVVLLDQTQRECATEHHCAKGDCPLARFFTGIDFTRPPAKATKGRKRVQREPDLG